jgi:hypothetical protein
MTVLRFQCIENGKSGPILAAKEMKSVQEIPKLIKELYGIVDSLEALFPGRHFTPDGHLVGSVKGN